MNEMTKTETQESYPDQPLTVMEVREHVQLIQQVLQGVMINGIHYGTIPGAGDKPILFKPGAEKIMATFRLAADPQVEDYGTDDHAHFRVIVRLLAPSGRFVGAGVGECSGAETKYRWRAAVCASEFDEAPADRRRQVWKKGYGAKSDYQIDQVWTNGPDLANTILKMAKKRALVDAVLTVTAASDIFSQDLEGPAETIAQGNGGPVNVPRRMHPAAAQPKAPSEDGQKLVDELTEVAGGGWVKLQAAWGALTPAQRESVGGAFGAIKAIAEGNDHE